MDETLRPARSPAPLNESGSRVRRPLLYSTEPTGLALVAMLRELLEELGLTKYSSIELVGGFTHQPELSPVGRRLYLSCAGCVTSRAGP
jgi:8-oxo-dGTP pyrophosphatase MutT (NUDIX family)